LGSFERLNSTNYIQWRINARTMLNTMEAWEIVTGEEKLPTEAPPAHSTRAKSGESDVPNLQQAIESFRKRRNSAEALIRYSVNSTIQKQLLRLQDPAEMWTMLSNQFNKTYSQTQRSIHASNLYTVRPRPGEKIGSFCERLQQYRDPVEGTKEAISDSVMIHHLLNFAGVLFSNTTHKLRKKMNKGELTLQETIDELCEYERNHLSHEINDPNNNTSGALLYSHGGGKNLSCQYCKKKGHHISDCRKRKAQESQKKSSGNPSHPRKDTGQTAGKKRSRDNTECWYCLETGHMEKDCPLKKRSNESKAARNQKRFGKKGSAMAADGDNTEQSLVLRSDLD
jgi:hypothetical protein